MGAAHVTDREEPTWKGQPLQYAGLAWLPGPLLMGGWVLFSARRSRATCEADLRAWYDRNHGQKLID